MCIYKTGINGFALRIDFFFGSIFSFYLITFTQRDDFSILNCESLNRIKLTVNGIYFAVVNNYINCFFFGAGNKKYKNGTNIKMVRTK